MREAIEHWKEGAGILLYFGFLAFFTPKAESLGWGYKGILFCVVIGGLFIFLLYVLAKCIAAYLEDHREEMRSFKEYMGVGKSEQISLASIGTMRERTDAELDALLAHNPYASPELFDDDKYTHLLPAVGNEEARPADEPGDTSDGRVTAIIGDNPRRRLLLADNFQPDANAPLGTGVFFVGQPDSGKTTTLVLFLEQYIMRYRLATVAFDIAGDLKSIIEDGLCPRGIIATPETLPDMAQVVKHRLQVVIDLQRCRKPGEAFINFDLAGQLIARIARQIMNAQSAIPSGDRLPCLLALDETHIWTPQTPPSYLAPLTAKDLLDTLTVVATTGRKYGVVPFLACQRIAKVHKDIIAGCETRILGKADLDNDIARYREYVSKDVISDQGIRSLGKGRMIVCMDGKRLLVQFYNRTSRHISHTPGVTGALNQLDLAGNIPPDLLASITRPTIQAVSPAPIPAYVPCHNEEMHQERRTSASLPVVAPTRELASVPEPEPVQERPQPRMGRIDLQKNKVLLLALQTLQSLPTNERGPRPLARAMGVSPSTASDYIRKLAAMGEL